MKKQAIELAISTLRAIRDARDFNAEHGVYPTNIEEGACFDDWAADMADAALKELAAADTQCDKE